MSRRRKPDAPAAATEEGAQAGAQSTAEMDWDFKQAQLAERDLEAEVTALAVREKRYSKGYVPFEGANRERFLAVLETSGSFQAAADAVGINVKTQYNARATDKAFAELCEEALERYRAALVAEIHRRAVVGVEEPVYQGGVLVGTKRVYSDRLLETLAKAKLPEFRDKVAVEHSGGVGVTVGVLVVSGDKPQSPEEWARNHALPPASQSRSDADADRDP